MEKIKNNLIKLLVVTFVIILAGIVAMFSADNIKQAKAEESSTPVNLYAELLNATNTYNSTESNYSSNNATINYGFTQNTTLAKNSNQIAHSFADITVFTHGWGVNAISWGGVGEVNNKLYLHPDSMVYQVAQVKKPPIGGFFY